MARSIPRQSSSALTAKSTGAENAHNSSNLTNKIRKYTKTLSYEISVRVKGTTLPILVRVLKSIDYWKAWFLTLCSSLHTRTSMRNKQQKFAQEKLSCKPRPFGLSVSRNLKPTIWCFWAVNRSSRRQEQCHSVFIVANRMPCFVATAPNMCYELLAPTFLKSWIRPWLVCRNDLDLKWPPQSMYCV